MRNIFLTVVVICALAVAGIGGTLADFSDIETSEDNYFSTGSMDLKVSVGGIEYDQPVPIICASGMAWPCCSKDSSFDLHSKSEGQGIGYAYIHIKDLVCSECPSDKFPTGRTEPENVAENGGWMGNVEVPGIGPLGQDCTLAKYVEVWIQYDTDGDKDLETILGNPVWGGPGTVYLSDLVCKWIDLGTIPNCNTRDGKISLHFGDIPEEKFGMDFFPIDSPLNDWPTNALQLDKVTFTIEFALFQQALLPGQPVYYPVP